MFPTLLLLLLALSASLLIVVWLNHRIFIETNLLAFYITRSPQRAYILYFLLMLPGIFVHEGSHWLAARLLGLRPGKFRVWPQAKGKHIRLGSVTSRSGGIWMDSIVGVAPLLVGSLLIALIGQHVFSAGQIASALVQGNLPALWDGLRTALNQTDSPLWAYLLFTLANGMMPSAPDREPMKPVVLYGSMAILLYLVLGLPIEPFAALLAGMLTPLQSVSSTLLLTILLDLLVLFVVSVLNGMIQKNR